MATLSGEAGAHRLDVALGERIRRTRKRRNMSQERLAEAVGVTFQQIQKYERGANRVSFSRLALIASALGTPLGELIDGLDAVRENTPDLSDALRTPGAAELVAAYAAIPARTVRQCLVELVLELAQPDMDELAFRTPCDSERHEPVQ